ncbi:MAG: Zn-dependent oligopeptidase [Deltaproteobacteria bacterium]|nr:Zn-dependent oligopeptidase [Deltaproteobacteria bacterium]
MRKPLLSTLLCFSAIIIATGCVSKPEKETQMNVVLNTAYFPKTAIEVASDCDEAIDIAKDRISGIINSEINTFENSFVELNDLIYEVDKMISPQYLLMNTSPEEAMRNATEESLVKYQDWSNTIFFNEDLYNALYNVEVDKKDLKGEDLKLYDETMLAFTRNGFGLSSEKREELEEKQQKISRLVIDYNANIRNYNERIVFTKDELEGVPESSLEAFEKDDKGNYLINPKIYANYFELMKFAVREETRKKAHLGRRNVARDINPPILEEIIQLRAGIASILGYDNYADFSIEEKMAKTGKTAIDFLENLSDGVSSKFDEETQALLDIKIRETGNPDAEYTQWDGSFYERILFDEKYQLDMDSVKKYFSMENCLNGMFTIYQKIFGISIVRKDPPGGYVWTEGIEYYEVFDSKTNEILGAFYLDLFPRDGKYNHFAQFGVMGSNSFANDRIERPVIALVCNFPKPVGDKPSLLSFDNVETLFHEFGHGLHTMLSKTKYYSFHGSSVARDFVEAPSQMLEQWLTDKAVLDLFAVNYQDPSDKIPADFLEKKKAADMATIAIETRGQVAFGLVDLVLYTQYGENDNIDVVKVGNDILKEYYRDYDDSAMVASFGHIVSGYAAGYYGYKWAEAISFDLAAAFKKSPEGFLDEKLGMKLRKEIYEPGGSREETESIKAFLGREWNTKAFFEYLGIE